VGAVLVAHDHGERHLAEHQHMTQAPPAPATATAPMRGRRTRDERPVVLVTGASRGLGFLIAQELAGRGHDLVICARSESGLDPARDELSRLGVEVAAVAADVGIEAEAQRLVAEAETRFGRLDVLVLNAWPCACACGVVVKYLITMPTPARSARHGAKSHPTRSGPAASPSTARWCSPDARHAPRLSGGRQNRADRHTHVRSRPPADLSM
jgi:hypothetical protein